ncbi:MAG: hypothetical protein J1E64_05920 [Acetatifactor sp.]|nr:hypothetical protein [Acetatifactor sp.]
MAGYVFAIGGDADSIDVIRECAEKGVYSTYLKSLHPMSFEGTLADYISMKPGDNIYFFCKRRFYGIGELICVGPDCKYCNYPHSSTREDFQYEDIRNDLLVDYGDESSHNRWLCTFKGSPYFFEEGIDTDEILTYKPNTFKMLRAFWKVSFIKLGDEENESLKEIFLLRRQHETQTQTNIFPEDDSTHTAIATHDLNDYIITPEEMLHACTRGDRVEHEMALEAAVVYDLCHSRIPELGRWDYVSHQVIASPFKPIDYMDKIDVLAMRYLPDTKIPCKYLVAELKKGSAGNSTIDQVLKYVDWVCSEYAYGDYDAIDACIIAAEYPGDIDAYYHDVVQRYYTLGSHPVRNKQWNKLTLLRYTYSNGEISYSDVTPPDDAH